MSRTINAIGKATILKNTANIKIFTIDDIKVDIVNYSYPWIDEPIVDDELTIASANDIGAMKLAAITGRGSRKDFIDIYFLLQEFTLTELLDFYTAKYADGSEFLVLKSLTYFRDADNDEEPVTLTQLEWPEVKQTIIKKHKEFVTGATSSQ